ncbi:MAG TPA: cell division regulator GpsB [Bacillales bacterium]|nr:cell division regulator GpsB [Bacillales bacterium]
MENEGRIHLTAKDVLEKDFKSGMRGYDKDDVDQYLDLIIKDYELFQKEKDHLEQENNKLRREIEKLQGQHKRQSSQASQAGNTNYDILKRLSNLEKHVFGSKLYE